MLIDIPILESIKDLQTQHGVKYENYQRYRSYCSRRLHRLRRSLNVHQGVASSAKARHQRGRKLMDVSNAMVLEAGEKDPEYGERMLLIPLCLAERAWSYAMQLKQETPDQPRRRFHLVRRLKKASEHAQRFEKLCHDSESPCSEKTKLEATAYAAYITGLYQVERENWTEAKDNLSKALSIYFKLSVSIKKEDVLEHYRQRIDELRASLRYCTFNVGDGESKKQITVELPQVLKFHDLAFKHAKLCLEQGAAQQTSSVSNPTQDTGATKMEVDKPTKPMAPLEQVSLADEDDDEFEETREVQNDEKEEDDNDEDEEGEDEEESDDDKQARPSGVTGLVKNWLGGAWSR